MFLSGVEGGFAQPAEQPAGRSLLTACSVCCSTVQAGSESSVLQRVKSSTSDFSGEMSLTSVPDDVTER